MRDWDGTDWWFAALVTLLTLGALLAALTGITELAHLKETP